MKDMDEWCKKTHGDSGLTAAIPKGTPLDKAEAELIEFCKGHFDTQTRVILAGNSIWNDRKFIDKYMKRFAEKLHYRMVDVSSFKEIFRGRYGIPFKKKNSHRAMDDIHESIRELGTYLQVVNVPENPPDSDTDEEDE